MNEIRLDIDLPKVCRICLSQTDMNEHLYDIFTDAIVDGMLVSLVEVIEYSVEIQVQSELNAPHRICQSCKTNMFQYYLFKQKCHRADNLLRSILQLKTHAKDAECSTEADDIDGNDFIVLDTVNQQHDSSVSASPRSDDYVEETIEEEIVAVFDNADKANRAEVMFQHDSVQLPGDVYEGNETLNVKIMNGEEYVSDAYEKSSDSPDVRNNIHDADKMQNPEHLTITPLISKGGTKEVVCDICGKTVSCASRLKHHMKLHNDSKIVVDHMNFFSCNHCRTMFLREEDLHEHSRRERCIRTTLADISDDQSLVGEQHHRAGGVCGVCDAKYDNTIHLKQHIIIHLDKYSCPLEGCGCEYASLARLSIHVTHQHVDYLSPSCPHCKEEIDRVDLRQHVRLFCKAKQFSCTHCDKKFLSSKALSQHLRNVEQTFQCSQCDKSVSSLASLRMHERTHTGARPYVCTICKKSYKTSSLRTAHMDTHIDGKTFKCSICGKFLQTRACYRNHVKRHLEERNHGCFVCGKKFFQKCTLRVHLKMVHRISRSSELQ